MEYRDMPEPLPLRKLLGPSVILAGVGVGAYTLATGEMAIAGFARTWMPLLVALGVVDYVSPLSADVLKTLHLATGCSPGSSSSPPRSSVMYAAACLLGPM